MPDISVPDMEPAVSEDVVQAESQLPTAIKAYRTVMKQDFTDHSKILEEEHGRDIRENVNFLICDPPYNMRSERAAINSALDAMSTNDMLDVMALV